MSDTTDAQTPDETEAKPEAPKKGGIGGLIIGLVAVTVLAGGLGAGLGTMTAGKIETAIAAREADQPDTPKAVSAEYPATTQLRAVDPVITNLASPSDIWVRMEAAMIYKAGALDNPDVTAAEIRQDILAYLRTVDLQQLEGPSALQHLREDLNERVQLRTDSQVSELVIQALVVQ